MTNPLVQCGKIAVQAHSELKESMDSLGSETNPNGYINIAYKTAMYSLPAALQGKDYESAVGRVIDDMGILIRSGLKTTFERVQNEGRESARRQLDAMNDRPVYSINYERERQKVSGAVDAVMSEVEAQSKFIDSVLLTGSDPVFITGDENHHGALKESSVILAATFWIAALYSDAWGELCSHAISKREYSKMVVSTMDNRVTDCCLRAHGQVQPFDKSFHLTGEPRFADYLDWTPFHWRCRSSISLYLPEYDNGITDRMIDSARQIIEERAKGIYIDRNPADAFVD